MEKDPTISGNADCWDSRKDVYPGQKAWLTSPFCKGTLCTNWDYDCDGKVLKQYNSLYKQCLMMPPPFSKCVGSGWSGNVVPAAISRLCQLVASGHFAEVKQLDDTLQPLNAALFAESNPIPVKWALAEMGLIPPHVRLPLTEYAEQYHEQMRAALAKAGVELEAAA